MALPLHFKLLPVPQGPVSAENCLLLVAQLHLRLLRHSRHQLGFMHVPTLNSSFHPTLQPLLLKATLNRPRQSLQTGRCGNQELIYFIGLCSLITTCDHTAFRFDQSLEPADLLLQFQCGHHGFQLEKKQFQLLGSFLHMKG